LQAVFFHGVVDRKARHQYFSALFDDVHEFEDHVKTIARQWRPISLAEVHAALRDGRRLPDRAVHISFDDGFRNNLVAAEILDRHNVPWTLFVVTDAVLGDFVPWYVRLANAVAASLHVRRRDGSIADLTDHQGKRAFASEAKAEIMSAPASETEAVLAAILALPGMRVTDDDPWPFLTLDELRQLRSSGLVEIGNHSARHVNLARCSRDELEAEVEGSRARLAAALDADVRYFSYPDGRQSAAVRDVVRRGHDLATAVWTARPGPWSIPRLPGLGSGRTLDEMAARYGRAKATLDHARWHGRHRAREVRYRVRPSDRALSPR
jgi:peptidoglycan/xylan/chitin deacetylase (PgdA/CDA1 family)